MEYRHSPGSKERTPLKRKMMALGIAGAALMSTAGDSAPTSPHEHAMSIVAERYIPPKDPDVLPVVGPEYTIIVPDQQSSVTVDHSRVVANEEALRAKGQWCETPRVPLFERATSEQLSHAAETRMGITTEEYQKVVEALELTDTKAESEAVVASVFAHIGVKATFNTYKSTLETRVKPRKYVLSPEYELAEYNQKLLEQVEALGDMPLEMAQAPDSVDFIEADDIGLRNPDKSIKWVDGFFVSGEQGENRIVIRLGAEKRVPIHEWAHALHNKACTTANGSRSEDGEFRDAYNRAVTALHSNRGLNRLKARWPIDRDGRREWFNDRHLQVTGFPSSYSTSDYAELFADLSTHLLLRGDIPDESGFGSEQTEALKQLTVERLKAAAPHADIASLVAARAAYPADEYQYVPFQVLLDKHVSPVDKSFKDRYDHMNVMDELVPAINIKSAEGSRNEFVYAFQSDIRMTAEGRYGGEYSISLNTSGSSELDTQLVDTALKYLRRVADEKDITLGYQVRQFKDSVFIIGVYRAEGKQAGESQVQQLDYSKMRRVPKGGVVGTGG